ncbi:MAG: hypothetical protein Kow0069_30600 [Promethearchaeota archaeon]
MKLLASRNPRLGRAISTALGALETPLLDAAHWLERRGWAGALDWFYPKFAKFYGSRVVPIDASLEGVHVVSPTEEIKRIIRRVPALSVGWCYCRRKHGNCSTSIWTCIHVGTAKQLDELAKRTPLKSATIEEVERLLDAAQRHGLVHQLITAPTSDYVYVICNCCPCCCTILRELRQRGLKGVVVESPFVAVDDASKCTGCGLCVARCAFGARTNGGLKGGRTEVTHVALKCFGCGLCVTSCPAGAIRLKRRSSSVNA